MSEWYPLYLAWLLAHPWAKRVSWVCSHAQHEPLKGNYCHAPTHAQKQHQTVNRIYGISDNWRGGRP